MRQVGQRRTPWVGALLAVAVVTACSGGTLLSDARAGRLAHARVVDQQTRLHDEGFRCQPVGTGNVARSATVICRYPGAGTHSLVLSWYVDFADTSALEPHLAPPAKDCRAGYLLTGPHWAASTGDALTTTRAHDALGGEAHSPTC